MFYIAPVIFPTFNRRPASTSVLMMSMAAVLGMDASSIRVQM